MVVAIIIIILIGCFFEYLSSSSKKNNKNKDSETPYSFFGESYEEPGFLNKKRGNKEFIKKEISEGKENNVSNKNNSELLSADKLDFESSQDQQWAEISQHCDEQWDTFLSKALSGMNVPNEISIVQEFKKYGVETIWHMTHKDNISSILKYGISSNKSAASIFCVTDISNPEVQFLRYKKDVFYNRSLHEYTPTYINIKNPMLYAKKDINKDLCLLEISISCLTDSEFIFTDGNAASAGTEMFSLAEDIKKLPWEVLEAVYWTDFPDGKRQRCAEVLVYPKIKPEHIKTIYCYSQSTFFEVSNNKFKFKIDKSMYF